MNARLTVGLVTAGLLAIPVAAAAGNAGFLVTLTPPGVQLPAGDVFADGDHVNVRTSTGSYGFHFESKCATRSDAECAGVRHDIAQYIGQSWFPLGAFIAEVGCIEWVQVAGFDYHYYGSCGSPSPSPTAPSPTPTASPTPTPTPTPTPQSTPTPEPTTTPQPEPSPTPTPTPEPSPTTSPTPTPSVTPTASPTPTETPGTTPGPRPTEGVGPTPQYTTPPAGRSLARSGGAIPWLLAAAGGALVATGVAVRRLRSRKARE